jgi:hypothetical protein
MHVNERAIHGRQCLSRRINPLRTFFTRGAFADNGVCGIEIGV